MSGECCTEGREEKCLQILVTKPERNNNLEEQDVGRIMLKSIHEKQDGEKWTGFIWLKAGSVTDSCEYGRYLEVPQIGGNLLIS
jgi:hypothetical protein